MLKRYQEDQRKQDSRTALVCAVIANTNRSKRRKPFKPKDFMPTAKKRRQSPEEMLAHVKALNKALGGIGGD